LQKELAVTGLSPDADELLKVNLLGTCNEDSDHYRTRPCFRLGIFASETQAEPGGSNGVTSPESVNERQVSASALRHL
jgi:hypothetical protein